MPRLMALADEFHLTTLEALDICDRMGIEAEDLASEISDEDADAFREGARGGLPAPGSDPAPPPAVAPGPSGAEPPSLAKQLGMSSAPPPPAFDAPPAPAAAAAPSPTPAAPGISFVPFGEPSAAPGGAPPPPTPPKAPSPPLRDRLPGPIADNLPVVIVGAVVLIALVAYVIVSTSSTSPPTDPEELGLENASNLTVDDCIDLPDGAEIADLPELDLVPSRSCSEPHDIELYSEVRTYQGALMERRGEYPGTEQIVADTLSECIARFEKEIGVPYRDGTYEVVALAPTGAMWLEPTDRVSLCGVASVDGSPLEGSVKGGAG